MGKTPKTSRPGYLAAYAKHARISRQVAAKELKKVGIDYSKPFDWKEADRLRSELRNPARDQFRKPEAKAAEQPAAPAPASSQQTSRQSDVPTDGLPLELRDDAKYAEAIRHKEIYKARKEQLEYEQLQAKLVYREKVDQEWFAHGRQIRDGCLNIPNRVAAVLVGKTEQEILDILMKEIVQVLEELTATLLAAVNETTKGQA